MTSQKTTHEKLNNPSPVEFIEGKSPSEVADKLGIFLEVHLKYISEKKLQNFDHCAREIHFEFKKILIKTEEPLLFE